SGRAARLEPGGEVRRRGLAHGRWSAHRRWTLAGRAHSHRARAGVRRAAGHGDPGGGQARVCRRAGAGTGLKRRQDARRSAPAAMMEAAMQTTALTPTLAGLADWLPVIIIIVT